MNADLLDSRREESHDIEDRPPVVLVVDDDAALRVHTRMVLQSAGYSVFESASGKEALEVAKRESLDCVLLDINMPGIGGVETCRRLRSGFSPEMLPIVMITGENNPSAITRAFEAGATDFVEKPVKWQVVRHRLHFLVRTKRFRDHAQTSESTRAALFRALPQSILYVDSGGLVRDYQAAVDDPSPVDWRALVGQPLAVAIKDDHKQRLAELFCPALAERGFRKVSVESNEQWGSRVLDLRGFQDSDSSWMVMVADWTEQLCTEQQLRELAFQDEDSGLPNARALESAVDAAINLARSTGGKVHVIRIELQKLDWVADTLGSSDFSILVNESINRIQAWNHCHLDSNTRTDESGWTLARTGRYEFTVCCGVDALTQECGAQIEDLLSRLSAPYFLDEHQVDLRPRIGVSQYPKDGGDAAVLVRRTGLAIRRVAQTGHAGYSFYSADTHTAMLQHLTLESRLRLAIETDKLSLVYQPKVDAQNGGLRGVEALLRWNEPDLGPIPPRVFIPVAESSGLIVTLGEYVMAKACAQHRAWLDAGYHAPTIAVNLSATEMEQRDLFDRIQTHLRHNALDHRALEVEITETAAIQSEKKVLELLARLADLGVRSAIDDFGTGYASIRYLHMLPVEYIKVDRSFIKDLPVDKVSSCITATIIDLSHKLGKSVIAEGVEEAAQLEYLSKRGCDIVQGYYTGKPVEPEAIARNLHPLAMARSSH